MIQSWTQRALSDAIEALDSGDAAHAEMHLIAALAYAETECPKAMAMIYRALKLARTSATR